MIEMNKKIGQSDAVKLDTDEENVDTEKPLWCIFSTCLQSKSKMTNSAGQKHSWLSKGEFMDMTW